MLARELARDQMKDRRTARDLGKHCSQQPAFAPVAGVMGWQVSQVPSGQQKEGDSFDTRGRRRVAELEWWLPARYGFGIVPARITCRGDDLGRELGIAASKK